MDPVLGVILAAAIGGLGTYLVAAKKMSGAVKSSDAEQLWTESRSIREWSADRIAQLTGIITSLEGRVVAVEDRNKGLASENERLLEQIRKLDATISELRDELHTTRASVEVLNQKLSTSEDRVIHLEGEAVASRRKGDNTNG